MFEVAERLFSDCSDRLPADHFIARATLLDSIAGLLLARGDRLAALDMIQDELIPLAEEHNFGDQLRKAQSKLLSLEVAGRAEAPAWDFGSRVAPKKTASEAVGRFRPLNEFGLQI